MALASMKKEISVLDIRVPSKVWTVGDLLQNMQTSLPYCICRGANQKAALVCILKFKLPGNRILHYNTSTCASIWSHNRISWKCVGTSIRGSKLTAQLFQSDPKYIKDLFKVRRRSEVERSSFHVDDIRVLLQLIHIKPFNMLGRK